MALEQDFEIFSGNDILLQISVTDADNDDDPLDLSGATDLIWALAKNAKATAIITKDILDGVSITDPTEGEVEITVSSSELEPLSGEYYHELRLTNSAGKKITLMFGTATINVNLIRS